MCHKPRPRILFSMESNFASASWRPNRWDLCRINSLIWLLPSSNFTTSNFLGVFLLLSWLGYLAVSSFGFCFSSSCVSFFFPFFWGESKTFFPPKCHALCTMHPYTTHTRSSCLHLLEYSTLCFLGNPLAILPPVGQVCCTRKKGTNWKGIWHAIVVDKG